MWRRKAELAVPPWPLLGVLLVLDVAAGVAALVIRRGELFVAALVASMGVLLTFEYTARQAPWPSVAVVSAVVFGGPRRGLVAAAPVADSVPGTRRWMSLPEVPPRAFSWRKLSPSARRELPGAPVLALVICCHLALVVTLLVVAHLRRWYVLAAVAVLQTFAAVYYELANGTAWGEVLLFDLLAWAPFVLFLWFSENGSSMIAGRGWRRCWPVCRSSFSPVGR